MMNKQSKLPQRELELLSAYIDGQLDDRQTRRLEARLRESPELRVELESLRVTVMSLRELPAPRPSRHFTLTPEMVGERESTRVFPVLRFATALAGLAFVALVGLEGLQGVSGTQLAARAPEMMQEAELAEDAVSFPEEPLAAAPAEEPSPELEAMELPAEEAAEQPVQEEPEALMSEQPEEEAEAIAGEEESMKATGTTDGADANGIASGEDPESRAAGETELEGGEGEVGEVDTPEEVTPGITDEQQAETTTTTELSPLRWLQVLTGALFIILSVLTITFRKRSV